MLRALAYEHEFTVFAVAFENPFPERIEWVRVPAPRRPLALLFVAFHFLAPLYYWLYRLRHRKAFDVIQSIETNLSFASVTYSHFCHTSYLKHHWPKTASLRASVESCAGWITGYTHYPRGAFIR